MKEILKYDLETVDGYKSYVLALYRVKKIDDIDIKNAIDECTTIAQLQAIEINL